MQYCCFWNLQSVQCIFWHVLKLLKCLQWGASVAHQNLLDWQSSKTTWFIPIHSKLIIMEVSEWGIEFVSKMYWWTSVRWCFPDQNCIFISARNWIVLQISFEDCSVVGVNTEFYFFFVRWEKKSERYVVWLKPLRVSANDISVTFIFYFNSLVIIL